MLYYTQRLITDLSKETNGRNMARKEQDKSQLKSLGCKDNWIIGRKEDPLKSFPWKILQQPLPELGDDKPIGIAEVNSLSTPKDTPREPEHIKPRRPSFRPAPSSSYFSPDAADQEMKHTKVGHSELMPIGLNVCSSPRAMWCSSGPVGWGEGLGGSSCKSVGC
jgi:hypothetical protein